MNRSGAAINVYPASGAAIEAGATNAAVSLASGANAIFVPVGGTQYRQR